jgi:hypothetical protein
MEGFISYKEDKNPLTNIIIPLYSPNKPVMKIYDNLFLDQTNFNLIEVNGTAYNSGSQIIGNIDSDGSTIQNIFVASPCTTSLCVGKSIQTADLSANLLTETNKTATNESLQQMPVLKTPWSYISQTPSMNTDTYQTFFIPVSSINTVLMYIANLTLSKSLMALKIQSQVESSYFISDPSFESLKLTSPVSDKDKNNDNMVTEPFYDPTQSVYQITGLVKFDYKSQNLLVKSLDGKTLSIYDNNKSSSVSNKNATAGTYTKTSTVNNFSPWTIIDANNNLIVYIPVDGQITTILFLQMLANQLSLYKSITFQKNVGVKMIDGVDIVITPITTPSPTPSPTPTPKLQNPTPTAPTPSAPPKVTTSVKNIKSNPISSYYNKPALRQSSVVNDDYILKTKLVPPISCPNCMCGSNCNASVSTSSSCCSCGAGNQTSQPSTTVVTVAPTSTPAPTTSTPTPTTLQDKTGRFATDIALLFKQYDISMNPYDVSMNALNSNFSNFSNLASLFNSTSTTPQQTPPTVSMPTQQMPTQQMPPQQMPPPIPMPTQRMPPQQTPPSKTTSFLSSIFQPTRNQINQRNSYFGNPSQPVAIDTQYGAQSGNFSTYIPITTDFSRFSK